MAAGGGSARLPSQRAQTQRATASSRGNMGGRCAYAGLMAGRSHSALCETAWPGTRTATTTTTSGGRARRLRGLPVRGGGGTWLLRATRRAGRGEQRTGQAIASSARAVCARPAMPRGVRGVVHSVSERYRHPRLPFPPRAPNGRRRSSPTIRHSYSATYTPSPAGHCFRAPTPSEPKSGALSLHVHVCNLRLPLSPPSSPSSSLPLLRGSAGGFLFPFLPIFLI